MFDWDTEDDKATSSMWNVTFWVGEKEGPVMTRGEYATYAWLAGNGDGLKSANAVKGGEGAEKKKKKKKKEEEWKPADANAERWVLYNKNNGS